MSADPLAIHGLGADANVYAYVSGRALQSIDPFGLEEKAFTAALLERAGLGSADAKFVAKLVYFANPSAAVADRVGIGTKQTATALKKGDVVGAAAAVGRTVKDVTGAGTGLVETVVHDQLQTAKAASAVTQLALGKGTPVKHLDTLGDFALHQATKAVVVATAGVGARSAGLGGGARRPTVQQLETLEAQAVRGLEGPAAVDANVVARPGEYLAGKAPKQVAPGTKVLEGQYVNDLGRVEPWKAHYDEFGRLEGRTDYNAGNKAAGIPETHHHTYDWSNIHEAGKEAQAHVPGEYVPKEKK